MNYTYKVKKDRIYDSTNQEHTVYSIPASDNSHVVIRSISDIFLSAEEAQSTVNLFNKEELSVHHFEDAVDDVLDELYGIF